MRAGTCWFVLEGNLDADGKAPKKANDDQMDLARDQRRRLAASRDVAHAGKEALIVEFFVPGNPGHATAANQVVTSRILTHVNGRVDSRQA